jgi:hypothetical protein
VLFPGDVRIDIVDPVGGPASITVRLQAGHLDVLDLDKTPPVPKQATASGDGAAQAPASPPPAPPPRTESATPPPRTEIAPAPPVPPPPTVSDARPREPDTGKLMDLDARPPEPEPDVSTRGWWLAGAGAVVTIAAVVLLPISSGRIESDRRELATHCVDMMIMNDTCTAMLGQGPAAQSLSDSIATWKAIRIGAMVGIGVGLATVGSGLLLRYRDGASATPAARPSLVLDHERGRVQLGLAWTFRF